MKIAPAIAATAPCAANASRTAGGLHKQESTHLPDPRASEVRHFAAFGSLASCPDLPAFRRIRTVAG
jgi:hypothetical protein